MDSLGSPSERLGGCGSPTPTPGGLLSPESTSRYRKTLQNSLDCPSPVLQSPRRNITYSDRFIPSRSASARLNFSLLERELAAAEVTSPSDKEAQEANPAYSMLLRQELLGWKSPPQVPADKSAAADHLRTPYSTGSKMFQYMSGHADSGPGGAEAPNPFATSPIGNDSPLNQQVSMQRKAPRKIPRGPFKVLDAPNLADDFYLNLVDWSSQNTLAVGLGSCVYLWSAVTCKVTKLCDLGSSDTVCSVAMSRRGSYLSVGTSSGQVQIWDVQRLKQTRTMNGHRQRIGTMAWNSHILATGSRDRSILMRDVRVKESFQQRGQAHRSEVCGLKWSPDDRLLASGGNDNQLFIWNTQSSTPCLRFTEHTAAVKAIAWSPHQHGLLASGGGTADRCIRFWNTSTNQELSTIDTGSQVCNLSWSKNVNEIISTHGYSQNQIIVWKYPNMAKLATLTGHTLRVLYLATSPDGQTIVTGAGDETLRFWNVFPGPKAHGNASTDSMCSSMHSHIR